MQVIFRAFFDHIYQGCQYSDHDCMYVYIYKIYTQINAEIWSNVNILNRMHLKTSQDEGELII